MAVLLKMVLVGLAAYALLALGACAIQDRLIFYPQPAGPRLPPAPAGWRVEALALKGPESNTLEGWVVRPAASGPLATVLYFGGNAEEVSWMAPHAPRFGPASMLVLVNYRGYGRSAGDPGEKALFADAIAIYDQVVARADVDPGWIVVHGRSLGTAVAVHLASHRPVCAVVLTSPFDSIAALARRAFPWLPVDLLLRHRFDAGTPAASLDLPLLAIAGGEDRVVPAVHSRRLVEAWRGPKRYIEIAGADHADVAMRGEYWEAIAAFVAGCGDGTNAGFRDGTGAVPRGRAR